MGVLGSGHFFWRDIADSTITFSDFPRNQSRNLILVREFDLNSPTTDELSPALQSFLETYTPPVVEEEVVSDANSFDVLNPLSYNGEFEAVSFTGDYTVPVNKSLIIQHAHNTQANYENISINNIVMMNLCNDRIGGDEVRRDFEIPIVVSSLNTVNTVSKIFGILVNKNFNSLTVKIGQNPYVIPEGKSFVMTHIYDDASNDLYVNGEHLGYISSERNHNNITIPFYFDAGTTIEASGSQWYENVSVHGILIDNSNYTYATDYELIDALNEGMDSLSTMSEMVVLENDSISSQNVILSQENEALMAIDYNFDSLQYVADFLSSQVFDLQQELLVPNIDVDMAIGWNMVGFSCPQQKNAEDALINIVDEVIIFKDNSGNVYMPEFSFNGIGDLTPGHGYQLKVTDYILDFNICE